MCFKCVVNASIPKMAVREKHRSPSGAVYYATSPVCRGGCSILLWHAPRGPLSSPEASPPSLFIWPFTWQEETGCQRSCVCKDNREPACSRSQSVRDGSCVHKMFIVARSALMMLNNILDYLKGGRRVYSVTAAEKDQRQCLFEKAKVIVFILCSSRFYNNCFGFYQNMMWHTR